MRASDEITLIRDEHAYHAHPHMVALPGGEWLLVANRAPRRRVTMHPPQDPEFINILIRSADEGKSWSAPEVAPGYGWTGVECAGLTALGAAGVMLNQWRFRWYPYSAQPSAGAEPQQVGPGDLKAGLLGSSEIGDARIAEVPAERLMPWIRGGGATYVHLSVDAGRSWGEAVEIATAPYSGGYGMRGAVALDGEILLPLSDIPHYRRIFLVRSRDGGRTWGPPSPVAALDGHEFEEPSTLVLADGSLVMLARENTSRTLFLLRSHDAGRSWSRPEPTGIATYPAHLVALPDGRLAAVTGRRHPPFGIELRLSDRSGADFGRTSPIVVRTGLPNKDLGYPTAAVRSDGALFVAYYYRDTAGVSGIYATTMAV